VVFGLLEGAQPAASMSQSQVLTHIPMPETNHQPVLPMPEAQVIIHQPNQTENEDEFVEAVAYPSNDDNLSLEEKEKEMIVKALDKNKGRRKKAAEALGISERTLYRKIKQYELE
jgi:transcriptional regulator with PAS, ATPase and Fis domain